MKAEFLFVSLNLNTIVQENTPETCHFINDAKKQGSLNCLSVKTRLLCAPQLTFLATRLVATASMYQKILWFFSSSAF